MRNHPALAAWLPTARSVLLTELLTVADPGGTTWRYASSADSLVHGLQTWLGSGAAGGLIWERERLKFVAGIQLGEATVRVMVRESDRLGGAPLASALRNGIWDAATFTFSRAYFDAAGVLKGVLPRFEGQLGALRLADGVIELTLKPASQTMNRAVPSVYQGPCLNTVFDDACGASRADFTVAGTVQAGSTAATVNTGREEAAAYFNGGVLTITSGPLAGQARTVMAHVDGGAVTPFNPFTAAPSAGDAYSLSPGCDRSLGDSGCARFWGATDKFLHHRGTPFIPLPDTAF